MLLNFAKSNIIEVEHSMWEASKSMQKTTDEEMVEKNYSHSFQQYTSFKAAIRLQVRHYSHKQPLRRNEPLEKV